MASVTVKVALESFSCVVDGEIYIVHKGDIARVGHPIMKGNEDKFGPLHIKFDHLAKG